MPLLLALAAASAAVSPSCHAPRSVLVQHTMPARSATHHLGDEPPADEIVAVYRQVDSCPVPIVLRRNIGTPDRSAMP